MENSPNKPTVIQATNGADLRPPERSLVRRRLIQSTLLPHMSQDIADMEDEEFNCDEDQDDDEEEYCGGERKKNSRKRNPKAVSQLRASGKVAINGKEAENKRMDEEDSPVIIKSDFFVRVSERRHQKKQQKEQLPAYSPNGNEKTCLPPDITCNTKSPPQLKRRAYTTPKKKRKNATPTKNSEGTQNEACCGSMLVNLCIQGEHLSQPIPDLRLEAKLTAEENSRIFAGKQIHPFFSSWKLGKRNLETTDLENNWCSIERKEKKIFFSPVHVFEKVQDVAFSLDWGNWIIFDRSFISTTWSLGNGCSPINEGSVSALDFDNFLEVSPLEKSFFQREDSLNAFPVQLEECSLDCSHRQQDKFTTSSSADEQVAHFDQQRDNENDGEIDNKYCFSEKAVAVQKLDVKRQGIYPQERMTSTYHDCDSQPENSLWTNKYQPEKAMEICGNSESVKFLNEWLRLWHEKGSRISITDGEKWTLQEDEYCLGDSDSEDIDDKTTLKNVLLVTGPVGSGKSAAIYACAKEQGFQVIEVNASDWRSGALVKQKFGEAVESHWLHCAVQNPEDLLKRNSLKPSAATCNARAAQGSENEVIELISVSDGEDSNNACGTPRKSFCQEKVTTRDQSEFKTLILFEDVDATVYEDRGFIATIQQLAVTAKRPMILTSNSSNPILPNSLDRLEVSFTLPSSEELLNLVYMVCALEKAQIEPSLVKRFVYHCQGDIRKTIMQLQFWCRGENQRKDIEVLRRYSPLVFDLDAGHRILPQIFPCAYPSHLSEMIEKEISKSLLMVEKNVTLTGMVEEEHNQNDPDSFEAKKDAMLNRHSSDFAVEYAAEYSITSELSGSSGSPVAFNRRNVRRRHDTILSSDSEGDCLSDRFPAFPGNAFDNVNSDVLIEINSESPSHCPHERSFNPITEQPLSEAEKLDKECYHSVEPDYSHVDGTCSSLNISCVPESSFVAETEMANGTVLSRTLSSGHADDKGETASKSNNLALEFKIDDTITGEDTDINMTVRNFDLNKEPVHGEEVGDSYIEHVEAVPRDSEMMDECSRMDFSRRSESMQKALSSVETDFVQETWKNLRHCRMDLQQYISLEQKDASQVLELAYKMTNLLSEADLLLFDCQSLICDYLEPSMVPSDKSHSFSWNDDQLQMASTIAQHGMCLCTKQRSASGLNASRVDLAWEMVGSSSNTMALGKLISQNQRMIQSTEKGPPYGGFSSKSKLESTLCSIVQSIVPSRSCLELKGDVFHEYLSSLSQISRSESSRQSESINKSRQSRGRAVRNYLSTGGLGLSPEDISLLGEYGCYSKVSDQSVDES